MMYKATAKATTETSKVMATTATTRVIPQHWCAQCGKQTWVVSVEEAIEIWAGGSQALGQTSDEFQVTELHRVKTESGTKLICLHSLFPKAF
jgi:hypothetical protein